MNNTFGYNLQITLFGESHGPYIGAVLDGIVAGTEIDEAFIGKMLTRRRPSGKISTARVEEDDFRIISGVFEGKATGTPICLLIPNKAQNSSDYETDRFLARPGHGDYTSFVKYNGFADYRGGGNCSGRLTAAIVAAGAVALKALNDKGIMIASHIASLGGIEDKSFELNPSKQMETLEGKAFPVLDENIGGIMQEAITKAAKAKDSVGGVLETAIVGLPAGVGNPWFDSVESQLSHAMFSIPGIKGIQFGAGFDKVDGLGSQFNDSFVMDEDRVETKTNNNGGVNGGISNGMPIIYRCAVKPTPSIGKKQDTVDFDKMSNESIEITGRHDPAIIHRAAVVVDCMSALVIYDMLLSEFGKDFFIE